MRVHRILGCFLLCGACFAHTAAELSARYGVPLMQRFSAGHNLTITVEYRPDGRVGQVEIAPAGPAASDLLAFFTSGKDESITVARETLDRNGKQETVDVIRNEMGFPLRAIDVTVHFGRPVSERFAAEADIGLTALYDSKGMVTEIRLAPLGPETDENGTRMIPETDGERLIDQLVPKAERTNGDASFLMASGCMQATHITHRALTITRVFNACTTPGKMNVTIQWKTAR